MNPIERIQNHFNDFTKTEVEIAVYIMNNPSGSARRSIIELAKETHSSKTALVRFSQKIGYNGFSEFRFDLSRFLVSSNGENALKEKEKGNALFSIADAYSSYILQLKQTVDPADLKAIAQMITKARYIKVLGYDRTFSSAQQFRLRLAKIGYDAEAVGNKALMRDIPDILTKKDLVILFTTMNNYHTYDEVVANTYSSGCPIVCFTMTNNLKFKKMCTKYLVLPNISRDADFSFLDNQAIYFVFIEMLLETIASITNVSY